VDNNDRLTLSHAENEVFKYLAGKTVTKIVEGLTDPLIRHHVQTILDLTPTKRG
jgi:hypothetical protein